MPLSDSASPVKRMSMGERTHSNPTSTKPSPSNRPKQHKAHPVGHGRLHNRVPSSKNLANLTKLTKMYPDEGATSKSHKARRDRSNSPPASQGQGHGGGNIKRNSSNVSLSRATSKATIKKNTSTTSLKSLKRNSSSTQVNKSSRPTTPLKRSQSHNEDIDKLNGKSGAFEMDDDEADEDEEWTEESASQSPSVTRHSSTRHSSTRHSSASRGERSGKITPPERILRNEGSKIETSPPELPIMEEPPQEIRPRYTTEQNNQNSNGTRQQFKPPDPDAITSRLLSRGISSRSIARVTSVSATGTPGSQTPPVLQHSQDSSMAEPSMPENGISRFIDVGSSGASVTSTLQLSNALHNLQTPPTPSGLLSRTRSSSPTRSDSLRRAKSTSNLNSASTKPTVSRDPDSTGRSPPSYTFEATQRRPAGGNTQAKLNLWRTQTHVEPSHGPPAPLMKGAVAAGMLGTEERLVRLWEESDAEMGFLRRFKNPVLDGAKRVVKRIKEVEKHERMKNDGMHGDLKGHHVNGNGYAVPLVNGNGHGEAGGSDSRKGSDVESRPPSRAGPRIVRFEVGLDPSEELAEEQQGVEGIQGLLLSLWAGGEMEEAAD